MKNSSGRVAEYLPILPARVFPFVAGEELHQGVGGRGSGAAGKPAGASARKFGIAGGTRGIAWRRSVTKQERAVQGLRARGRFRFPREAAGATTEDFRLVDERPLLVH